MMPARKRRRPGVRPHVVVIAPRREEQRARIAPHRQIEPQRPLIEGGGTCEVADVQVDVAHRGARRHTRPRHAVGGAHQIDHVERDRRHRQFLAVVTPARGRTVGIHLDPQPVGIGQIDRLADLVVRHPGLHAHRPQVRDEASE